MNSTSISVALGLIIPVAGVYFAYLTVPGERFPRWMRRDGNKGGQDHPSTAPISLLPDRDYDVFVSHADADTIIAQQLAERLRGAGLRVFLARWVTPGLVMALEADQALRTISHGILLVSETTQRDHRVMDDYAAVLQRVHTGGQRLIPILIGHVRNEDLPPLIRIRQPVDLRKMERAEIEKWLQSLADLIRSDRLPNSRSR